MSYNTYYNQKLLKKIPQFELLDHDELSRILADDRNRIEEYGSKEIIIREKEFSNCMYLILEGHVELFIQDGPGGREIPLTTLHSGDSFGEQSKQEAGQGIRNSSVRALHPCKILRIDHSFLNQDNGNMSYEGPEDELLRLLKPMRLFQSLTEEEYDKIQSWAEIEIYKAGEFIFREDDKADAFFVVLDGLVERFVLDDDDKINFLGKLEQRCYFGEHALLPGQPQKYAYFCRCDIHSQVVRIEKAYFDLIMFRDHLLLDELKTKSSKLLKDINALK